MPPQAKVSARSDGQTLVLDRREGRIGAGPYAIELCRYSPTSLAVTPQAAGKTSSRSRSIIARRYRWYRKTNIRHSMATAFHRRTTVMSASTV